MILTITGPSAAGKTVLLRNLQKVRPDIKPLLSTTTRAPRESESDLQGEYRYVDERAFEEEARAGKFLWHVEAHGNRYGTLTEDVDRALESGVYVALLLTEAAKNLHLHALGAGKKDKVRSIYLRIDDEAELRRRLTERNDPNNDVERRLNDCRTWNHQASLCGIRFRIIETIYPQADVLADAIRYLESPLRRSPPL